MRTSATRVQAAAAIVLALALALSIGACGSSSSGSSHNEGVTLTIAWPGYPQEPAIVGEIYSQALEAAGYTVKHVQGFVSEAGAKQSLLAGELSGYPLSVRTTLVTFFEVEREDIPTSEAKAYAMLKADLEKEGLTALAPAPYVNSYLIGTFRKTADELGLKTDSDLKGKSERLILSGAQECPELIECLPGLKKYYGLEFKAFHPVYLGEGFKELESGTADLSMIFATEPQLAGKSQYVTLEDDKHVFPAGGKTVFLTSQEAVEEAGPDLEKTVAEAQEGLTLPVVRSLNAEVELEGKTPKAVARGYLKSQAAIE